MKKLLCLLALALLVGCTLAPIYRPTPTQAGEPTATGGVVTEPATTAPTNTPVPPTSIPATATPGEDVTPTMLYPSQTPDIRTGFENGSFEGSYMEASVCNEDGYCVTHATAPGWLPFYCGVPYTPEQCPAMKRCTEPTGCNPPDLIMGRPEFKPTALSERVRSGTNAQVWFLFHRLGIAGVYQTVQTVPGRDYEIGMHGQSWSATGNPNYLSDLKSTDDWDSHHWFIAYATDGDTFMFADDVVLCGEWWASDPNIWRYRTEGYLDKIDMKFRGGEKSFYDWGGKGFYDQYKAMSCVFTATGPHTTIFFGTVMNWRMGNNDAYLDDVYIKEYD